MRFVLAVGDVFHVEGNDVFCVASKNRISCPKDKKADRYQSSDTIRETEKGRGERKRVAFAGWVNE